MGADRQGLEEIARAAKAAGRGPPPVHLWNPAHCGTIDIVINQDAGHEVRSAIRVLMSRADRSPIVKAMERIRIDVYVRDNIP